MELDIDLDAYGPEERPHLVATLVEALAEINLLFLQRHQAPALERSGVAYKEGGPWRDIPRLLATREGDCRSLVAWRLAELRIMGRPASLRVLLEAGPYRDRMHLQVVSDQGIEDPSVLLGMG